MNMVLVIVLGPQVCVQTIVVLTGMVMSIKMLLFVQGYCADGDIVRHIMLSYSVLFIDKLQKYLVLWLLV